MSRPSRPPSRPALVAELIREAAEPLQEIEEFELGPLIERIGNSRLVLIGEATHGTSEFYRMRAEITKQLITRRDGFRFVAIEADWPDAARIDGYVRHLQPLERPSLGGLFAVSHLDVAQSRSPGVHRMAS